ncbi:MAG: LysR family transcriptional regulator [Burkholderiales bacterium]|nr:LysR family transcriptional regulator [Burkholderiales bacterium]
MSNPHLDRARSERDSQRRAPGLPAYRVERLRLRHLRLLERIDAAGSLGSAARALGISQPAATVLLRELETVFDAVLVERDARGARLSAAGHLALERIRIALASVGRALEAVALPAAAAPLRVGCVQVAGVWVLPAALCAMEQAGTPGRMVVREGRTGELLAALCTGELDCVIGWMDEALADALPAGELDIEPLGYGSMQVVASVAHPLARSRAVSVAQLSGWHWIVPPRGSRTHSAYLRLFLHAGIPAPSVVVECPALHTALHIVGATRFLAVAPDAAARHYARLGLLKPLEGPALRLEREQFALVTRRDSEALPGLRVLRQALQARAPARDGRTRTRGSPGRSSR